MKRKIVGILVCMLVIATAIPAVISVKNNPINTTIPSTSQTYITDDWIETQKLLASDGATNDKFSTCSLDGDTAIITAWYDDDNGANSGSVYVFIRTGTTWTEQTKLIALDGEANDNFGIYASLDGDTALIGAPADDDNGDSSGSAYVFTRSGTTWTQQAKLLPSDGAAGDMFGDSVCLFGETAIIGAYNDDDNGDSSGSAYVFTRSGTTWTQQAKLLPSDGVTGELFGVYISLSGDTALIGACHDDGSAYVFIRSGTIWTQQAKLVASDSAAGDNFGKCVSLEGDIAVIGADFDDNDEVDSGSAYVFTRSGTTWTQQAKLLPSDGAAGDSFGNSVFLSGDNAIIAAPLDDDKGTNSGSVYIFTRTGTTWTQQQKLLASDGAAGDTFSYWSVCLDGDTAIIGAEGDDDNGANSGSAYVFIKSGADLTFSIKGGLGVKAVIKNNGTSDATDVPWQIHVEGGILGMTNKTVNGTIDIPAGDSVTVTTGLLLGLGGISIIADVADEEQTAEGTQLIIFSMVKT